MKTKLSPYLSLFLFVFIPACVPTAAWISNGAPLLMKFMVSWSDGMIAATPFKDSAAITALFALSIAWLVIYGVGSVGIFYTSYKAMRKLREVAEQDCLWMGQW